MRAGDIVWAHAGLARLSSWIPVTISRWDVWHARRALGRDTLRKLAFRR